MNPSVKLRPVQPADIPIFFEHQGDPESLAMAGHTPREREAFFAHWERILANDANRTEAVDCDGTVTGYVCRFEMDGVTQVAYWIGRAWWGRGIATRALGLLLDTEPTRPLHAFLVPHNVASRRVLEKCGFVFVGEEVGEDGGVEVVMRLD